MKTLFTVTFVIELFFVIGLVGIPATMMGLFGEMLDPFGVLLTRLFGSALLALVVLLWAARSSSDPAVHRTTVITMFAYYLASVVLVWIAQLTGVVSLMGWGTVVLRSGLLVVYAVALFRGPRRSMA